MTDEPTKDEPTEKDKPTQKKDDLVRLLSDVESRAGPIEAVGQKISTARGERESI
jgi:hypothetical protein